MNSNAIIQATKQHPFLIMAHRGFRGGNIIENTRQSAQLAFMAGADIIELDVCRSKDHVYYVFHSTQEKKMLGLDKHFHDLTSQEIDACYQINSIGMESDYRVERFEDYLEWFPKDKIINIDRSWWYWDDPAFFELIDQYGMTENCFIKNSLWNDGYDYLLKLNQSQQQIPYLPIATCQADYRKVQELENVRLIGIEMILMDPASDLLEADFMAELKANDQIILMDGEKLGRDKPFFFGREDDYSMLVDPDKGWGEMYRLGANVIETDWPNFLNEYRKFLL